LPYETKEDCHDHESDKNPTACGNEEPNSHDPKDQCSEDTQPADEIKQTEFQPRQRIMAIPDWDLTF
jgi:hypothetical protein